MSFATCLLTFKVKINLNRAKNGKTSHLFPLLIPQMKTMLVAEIIFSNLMKIWNQGGHWRVVDASPELNHHWHIDNETGLYRVLRSGTLQQWVDWKVIAFPLVRNALEPWTLRRSPAVDTMIREVMHIMEFVDPDSVCLACFYCSQQLVLNAVKNIEESEVLDDFPYLNDKPQWMWTFPFFYAAVA